MISWVIARTSRQIAIPIKEAIHVRVAWKAQMSWFRRGTVHMRKRKLILCFGNVTPVSRHLLAINDETESEKV